MPDEERDMPPEDRQEPSLNPSDADVVEDDSPIGVYSCPHCNAPVAVDSDERGGPFITCPDCGESFAIPATDAQDDDEARAVAARARDAELDGMRIRQLSLARRAAIRARTYLLIAAIGCVVGAEELIRKIFVAARYGKAWGWRTFAFGTIAIVALTAARRFWMQFVSIGRELNRPLLQDPAEPPGFSSLSDGSQKGKELHDMQ